MDHKISNHEETLYDCVQSLISAEPHAKEFYLSLSEAEQGAILCHSAEVCSYERLQSFVENVKS